ncbi:MAG: DoxX family protein [Candidatus Sungiibacteriota bacterium]
MMMPYNKHIGVLLIRLGLAYVFIIHGWSKFMNIAGTTQFFASLGLPWFMVYFVAGVEVLGGLAILLGIRTQWAGFVLAINMLAAMMLTTSPRGFAGHEFEMILFLMALAAAFIGAGKYAVSSEKAED